MTLRIRVEELGDEVRECLERGEAVEIERDGEVVGRVEPAGTVVVNRIVDLVERLRSQPPIDDEFARDLEQIHKEMNQPIGRLEWE